MAEFQEVMKQWGRLCKKCDDCSDCILTTKAGICDSYAKGNAVNAAAIERIVMDWAMKHPEPQLPTWYDWLRECYPGREMGYILTQTIPDYVAEKLEIEAKEVEWDADGKTSLP